MNIPTTHKFNAYRFLKSGSTEEYNATPTYQNIDCLVVPASTDIIMTYQGVPGFQLYEITTQENVELKNGDKLVSGSEEYIVKDVAQRVENVYMFYVHVVGQKKV